MACTSTGGRSPRSNCLLAAFRIARSPYVDKALGLARLEETYGGSYLGIGNGTPAEKIAEKLGTKFWEYPGQSEAFREIYFPEHDVEIAIQEGVVRRVRRGKPGWMSDHAIPPRP